MEIRISETVRTVNRDDLHIYIRAVWRRGRNIYVHVYTSDVFFHRADSAGHVLNSDDILF